MSIKSLVHEYLVHISLTNTSTPSWLYMLEYMLCGLLWYSFIFIYIPLDFLFNKYACAQPSSMGLLWLFWFSCTLHTRDHNKYNWVAEWRLYGSIDIKIYEYGINISRFSTFGGPALCQCAGGVVAGDNDNGDGMELSAMYSMRR